MNENDMDCFISEFLRGLSRVAEAMHLPLTMPSLRSRFL